MHPILIPSKGRPNGATFATLRRGGVHDFAIIVEPNERAAYWMGNHRTKLLTLEKNNAGIVYARQHGRESVESEWYWMLDDDITEFFITDATLHKNRKATAGSVMAEAESRLAAHPDREKIGIVALEYQQLAWNARAKQEARNSYADVAILVRRNTPISYRDVAPKEDRDFALQHIAAGYATIRFRDLSFSVPQNGSNRGGLHELYQETGREEQGSRKLAEMWPGVVTFHRKPNGRPDAKINWRVFTNTKHDHETERSHTRRGARAPEPRPTQ